MQKKPTNRSGKAIPEDETYKVILTSQAKAQIAESYNYYEGQRIGLGERFLQELEKRYADLSKHPEYYSFIDKRKIIRDVKIERSPYVIIFEIEENKVIILYIHNTSKQSLVT
ncbi:MAG: type II toxin-antitoxin system RelE/ParE family toxin [Chitinophagaceae bacterium]